MCALYVNEQCLTFRHAVCTHRSILCSADQIYSEILFVRHVLSPKMFSETHFWCLNRLAVMSIHKLATRLPFCAYEKTDKSKPSTTHFTSAGGINCLVGHSAFWLLFYLLSKRRHHSSFSLFSQDM